jgi:hypothetical protein
MSSQRYSANSYKDFDPQVGTTVKKEQEQYKKLMGKDRKKNKKYRRKEQFIATVSK